MEERLAMIEGVYNIKPSDIMASVALEKFEKGGINVDDDSSLAPVPAQSPKQNRSPANKGSPHGGARSSNRNISQEQTASNKKDNVSIIGDNHDLSV